MPRQGGRAPYYGYLFRPLFVAYPATYGVSGITTFIVSHDGVVYQKDFGPKTAEIANAMKTYNPDKTWTRIASDTSAK